MNNNQNLNNGFNSLNNMNNQNFNNDFNNSNNMNNQNFNNGFNPNQSGMNYQNNFVNNGQLMNQLPKKSNKKVIIIVVVVVVLIFLAFLIVPILMAAPATNKYLDESRKSSFVDNGRSAISYIKVEVMVNGLNDSCYTLDEINQKMEKPLLTSPFGTKYSNSSYIYVYDENTYSMCLVDEDGNGFEFMSEDEISSDIVTKNVKCNLPAECK